MDPPSVFFAICLNHFAYDPWQVPWLHATFLEPVLKDHTWSPELEDRYIGIEKMMMREPGERLGLQGKRLWTDRGKTIMIFQTLHMIAACYTMWNGVASGHVDPGPWPELSQVGWKMEGWKEKSKQIGCRVFWHDWFIPLISHTFPSQ